MIKNKNKKIKFHDNNKTNKKKNNYFIYLQKKKEKNQKPKKYQITNYLYINKKIKKGVFFKTPTFNEIKYPIHFNLKLINEYLKKK